MIYEIFLVSSLVLFALLARANYAAAVVLLAGLLPTYLVRFSVAGVPTNMWEAATVVVLLAGLSQPAVRQASRQAARQLPLSLWLWLALWLAAGVISTVISAEPRVSAGILKSWIIIPLLFAAQGYVMNKNKVSGTLSTGYLTPSGSWYILRAVVVSGAVVALLAVPALLSGERARSIYDVPNSLALYLAPLFVITVWLGWGPAQRSLGVVGWRLAGVVLGLGIVATQSVAAIGATVAALSAVAWRLPWRQRRGALLALGVVIAVAFAYWHASGRLEYFVAAWQQARPTSLSVRQQLWSVGVELVGDHPLLGVGLGQFEPSYQQVLHQRFRQFENCLARRSPEQRPGKLKIENCTRPLAEYVFRDPHNWVLSFWLNTGILGLVSFVALHAVVIRSAFKGVRYPTKKVPDPLVQALVLALLAIALHGLVDTVYWKNDLAALQWLILGLLLGRAQVQA